MNATGGTRGPQADPDGTPVDPAAVRADDALLDLFGGCTECGEPMRYVPGVGLVGDGGVCRHPLDPTDEPGLHVSGATQEREFEVWLRRADAAFLVSLRAGLDPEAVLRGIRRRERSLFRTLRSWRRDVDAEPIGELVDTGTAVAAISAARRPIGRKHPVLGPVVAVLALLVIAVAGVGLVAKDAEPGDLLWPVHEVLYPLDGE